MDEEIKLNDKHIKSLGYGKKVLNLGCGKDTYGDVRIDLYETETSTDVVNLDYEKIPYPDNFFDEIYCKSILEHLKNLDNFEKECFRVLKPNGDLIVRTDHAGYIMWYISDKHEHNDILMPYYEKHGYGHDIGDDAHYHLYVASHLKKLFKRFTDHEVSYFCGGRNWFAHQILTFLPYHIGASEIRIDCTKPRVQKEDEK